VALTATKSASPKRPSRKPARSTAIGGTHASAQALVELNRAAGDSLRQNILQLVARESFAVLELARILDVAQTALSHHLKLLLAAGLLSRRREGTSLFYRRALRHSGHPQFVEGLYSSIDTLQVPAAQLKIIDHIHTERRQRRQEFFSANSEQLAEQSTLISNPETYAEAAGELLKQADCGDGRALEVGPGEGQLLTLLAQQFSEVTGIDSAEAMLQRAANSITDQSNVRLQLKDFAELPARRVFDAIAAAMVLHHQPSPLAFFQQGFRVLKPGGVLIIVDLCRHDQEWVKKVCGDFWLGFEPDELMHWGERAGFTRPASQYLTQNNGFQLQLHAFSKQ